MFAFHHLLSQGNPELSLITTYLKSFNYVFPDSFSYKKLFIGSFGSSLHVFLPYVRLVCVQADFSFLQEVLTISG